MISSTSIKAILAVLVAVPVTVHAAEERPFDSQLKVIEESIEVETAKCRDHKNPMAKVRCREDVWDRQKVNGKMRGTRTYAETNYFKLPTEDLEQKHNELSKQQDRARELQDFSRVNPRPPGELTKEALGVELGVIEEELRRRGRARDESNIKKWKEMTGKEPPR